MYRCRRATEYVALAQGVLDETLTGNLDHARLTGDVLVALSLAGLRRVLALTRAQRVLLVVVRRVACRIQAAHQLAGHLRWDHRITVGGMPIYFTMSVTEDLTLAGELGKPQGTGNQFPGRSSVSTSSSIESKLSGFDKGGLVTAWPRQIVVNG